MKGPKGKIPGWLIDQNGKWLNNVEDRKQVVYQNVQE